MRAAMQKVCDESQATDAGPANTLEMSEERLRELYPDGPRALPPELDGG